jgi:hypothetical protein
MSKIKQNLYDHGSSRIYRENEDGTRDLLVDTYGDAKMSKYIYQYVLHYLSIEELL